MRKHQETTAVAQETEGRGAVSKIVSAPFRHSDRTIGITMVAVLVLSALS
jgi:RNA:NAD 2'-phosphotransferase (TPT1/KptA family)